MPADFCRRAGAQLIVVLVPRRHRSVINRLRQFAAQRTRQRVLGDLFWRHAAGFGNVVITFGQLRRGCLFDGIGCLFRVTPERAYQWTLTVNLRISWTPEELKQIVFGAECHTAKIVGIQLKHEGRHGLCFGLVLGFLAERPRFISRPERQTADLRSRWIVRFASFGVKPNCGTSQRPQRGYLPGNGDWRRRSFLSHVGDADNF